MVRKILLLLGFSCVVATVSCGTHLPARPEKLGRGEISLNLPKVSRWELSNGMVVHYLHDPELPMMRGSLMVPGGSLFDSPDKPGLASFTGGLMREGSVRGMAPDALDARLDELGAQIESSFGDEFGTVKFSSLSSDFKEVFSLFSRVVKTPAFDPARFALVKKLTSESIRRRRDDPSTIASMTFALGLYGPHSPYSSWVTDEVVRKMSVQDLERFHSSYMIPNYAHLSLTGSLTQEEVAAAIQREFGSWEKRAVPRPEIPAPPIAPKPAVYVVERDFVQSSILIGHKGPPRKSEDQHAITIFNRIFGQGGFGTVLLSEIRTKLGYVYSIYGGLFPGAVAGVFQIDLQSRNETAIAAIKRVKELVEESGKLPPQGAQLTEAKDTVARSFVFKFDGSDDIVTRQTLLEFWGYPVDFDDVYLAKIGKVTEGDVLQVSQRWINPSDLVVVIVGGVPASQVAHELGDTAVVYRVGFDSEPKIEAAIN